MKKKKRKLPASIGRIWNKMLYIRTDANEIIATGHVMRCLAIADALKKLGEKVIFLMADDKGRELVEARGYEVNCLGSRWDALEEELDVLIHMIEEHSISKLLIDSYQVTPQYMESLSKYTEVIYLDDLDVFPYPCSRIINYAVYAEECSYGEQTQKSHLLGCAYMPLREVFGTMPKKNISTEIKYLLFLSGGADHFHFTKKFLEKYKEWEDSKKYVLTVICGRFQEDYKELCRMADKNIIIKSNVTDIERDMQQADVAVSAGGTTLYELCACGTPTISYVLADNQKKNTECFARKGLIPYCGDVRTEAVSENILRQIEQWAKNPAERAENSEKMQKLVDGKGAERLAKALL